MRLPAPLRDLLARSGVRQGAVVLLEQGLLSVANFVTGVLVARACTLDDYGVYVLATSVLMIAIACYRSLVQVPFAVFLPRLDPDARDRYQGSALVHTLLIAGVFSVGLWTAPAWTSALGFGAFAPLAPVAGLVAGVAIPFVLRDFARNSLFARLRFFSSVAVSVVATTLQLALVAGLFVAGRLTLEVAFAIIGATCLAAAVLMLAGQIGELRIVPPAIWKDFLRGWHVSRWSLMNVLGMIGTAQAYPWLLLVLADTGSVALYGAAFALAGVTAPLVQAATAFALPKMAHGMVGRDPGVLRVMLRRAVLVLLVPFALWTVVGSVFADELMRLLYSDRYADAALVVVLLLVRSLVEGVGSPFNPALQALERTFVTTQALLLGTVFTFTAGAWAVGTYGLSGAAGAALATTVLVAGYKLLVLQRLLRAPARAG